MRKMFYSNRNIEINLIMDDQGKVPLTYYYDIMDFSTGDEKTNIDIRTLNAYKEYFKGNEPRHFEFYLHKKVCVPAIIKLAIKNKEIEFQKVLLCGENENKVDNS